MDSDDEVTHSAWASGDHDAIAKGNAKFTTKIPPSFDGRISWFQYEDLVEEWLDITSLDPEKQGPALRSRLDGVALQWKAHLDRDSLKDPENGVKYFEIVYDYDRLRRKL